MLGMQDMLVKTEAVFGPAVLEADAIVVPGGRTAGAKLIAREDVLETLRAFDRAGKLVCAMCSGTTVAHAAGVLDGKRVTGYTGYAAKLTGAAFVEDEVAVWDVNVVTSAVSVCLQAQGGARHRPPAVQGSSALCSRRRQVSRALGLS